MKTYLVGIREVHVRHMRVRATSINDAIVQAEAGECTCDLFEFSHVMDKDSWSVEEIPPRKKS